jgi:hypothetical protein
MKQCCLFTSNLVPKIDGVWTKQLQARGSLHWQTGEAVMMRLKMGEIRTTRIVHGIYNIQEG